ncbi:TPA: type VI secretion protein, partial [Escherichia coli]|nr:type VI secretion protein [Escherichia coli]
FALSVSYVIGILRNWTDTTILLFCFFIILVTIFLRLFFCGVHVYFSTGKYRRFLEIFFRQKRTSTLDSHFRKGLKIISKKGRGSAPWFLLTSTSGENTSLLKDIKLPVFHNKWINNSPNQVRTIRWCFFRDLSVLELSSKIYDNPGLFNAVIKLLSLRITKKHPPQGVLLVIPVEQLTSREYTDIQVSSHKVRTFIEQISLHLHKSIPVFLVISGCEHISGYSALAQKIQQKNGKHHQIFWTTNKLAPNVSGYDSSYILSSLKSNITLSICNVLDDNLSGQEKNEILLFPDKLNDLKNSLDAFISTFCIDNMFFSQAEISGVCLSGDIVLSESENYSFADILISEILPQIQNSEPAHANKRITKISFKSVILMSVCFFIGCSAYSSYNVYGIKPGSADSSTFLIEQILKYEEEVKSNLLYFPFEFVLYDRYLSFKRELDKYTKYETSPASQRIAEYKRRFMEASPSGKRDLILSLSSALIVWDKMAENDSLSLLAKYPSIHESLKITKPLEKISSIASLAIERDEIQKQSGIKNIELFRDFLTELIKSDPSYSWFVSEYVNIPAVNITDFWEDEDTSVYLSGIWTQQGQNKLHIWYTHIKEAYGRDNVPEDFSSFVQNLDENRQEQFSHFIMAIARVRKHSHSGLMSPLQLSDIIHNRSSEHKFFQFIDQELRDIPASSAQEWLSDFRGLYRLFSLKKDNGIQRQIKKIDLIFRTYLLSFFYGRKMYRVPEYISIWMDWQNVLCNAVDSELHAASSVELIRNAIRLDPKNNLVILFDEFKKIRSIINANNTQPVIDSVWDIYEQQIFQLLDQAVTYTGCWVNEQWRNSVLNQLNSDEHYLGHTEMQSRIYKKIVGFLKGPANGFLVIDPDGARLLSFKGRSISFSPSFIGFINSIISPDDLIDIQFRERTQNKDELINIQEQLDTFNNTLQKVESQPYKITITSAPATIPGNSRVKPIGTTLILECKTVNNTLRSMNFADSDIFTWYPGSCNSVIIDIAFPDFSAIYKFTGESAWIDFINKFSDGEDELMTEDFSPESRSLLESMGIKGILVRYKLSDASNLIQASIEWEQLKLEKDKLENLNTNLSNKLFAKYSWENSGWISKIPSNITICPAVRE